MIDERVKCIFPDDMWAQENIKPSELKTILEEAQEIVQDQRQKDYGDVTSTFNRIASLWTAYTGVLITPLDVAQMMILLKVARGKNNYKRDNLVDIAGYAYCADILHRDKI